MADVFVSYAREDRAIAERMAGDLESAGLDVWWDRSLLAGADIEAEIDRQLSLASAVLVIWSETSAHSTWVKSEANAGLDAGKLVPVRIDAVRVPRPFDQIHTIDVAGGGILSPADLDGLVASVQAAAQESSPATRPAHAKRKLRRRMMSAGAIVTGTAAAAGLVAASWSLVSLSVQTTKGADIQATVGEINTALARIETDRTQDQKALDERYLREIMRRLQMSGQPVDELTLALVNAPNPDQAAIALDQRYNTEAATLSDFQKKAILHQAAALYFERDHEKATTRYKEILRLDPGDYLALASLARLSLFKHDFKTARIYADAARSARPPNRATELELEITDAYAAFLADDIDTAEARLVSLMAIAKAEELDFPYAFAGACLGQVMAYTERSDEARALIDSISSLVQSHNFYSLTASNEMTLGDIDTGDGNWANAASHYAQWLAMSQVLGRTGSITNAHAALGQVLVRLGQLDEARTHFMVGLTLARDHAIAGGEFVNLVGLAEADARAGNTAPACDRIIEAEAVYRRSIQGLSADTVRRLTQIGCGFEPIGLARAISH